ncbi:MAG: ABC transporter permease subunit [Candidatus Omnitrophica bacterium]|nr:ABC transporter permease subunit [Candidatus Omnitrophota bacterium]
MDLVNVGIILRKEIEDARRNRWFILLSVIFSGLTLTLCLFGYSGLGNFGVAGFGRTAASILNLVLLIVPLMGLVLGAVSISGEREHGTLLMLLAQPVTSSEILVGKYLGVAIAVSGSLLLGFGLSGMVIGWYGGAANVAGYLILVGFTLLLGLVTLGLGFCLSVFNHKSATAIGGAIFVWFLLLFISDLGMMGTAMVLKLAPRVLLWFTFLNPVQVFRLAVINLLHGDLESLGGVGTYAMEVFGSGATWFFAGFLFLWVVVPLVLSLVVFKRKCVL